MEPGLIWKQSYSVGVLAIDRQHQQLLVICAEVEHCMGDDSPKGTEAYHLALNDMQSYAETHFKTEETLLARYGYSALALQQQDHADYLVRLNSFLMDSIIDRIDKHGLYQFLTHWWRHHILESDMEYSAFLREHLRRDGAA